MIYVAMAACATGTTGTISPLSNGTGGGASTSKGTGGAGGAGGGGLLDSGIMDALMDPVATAAADPISGTRLKARFRLATDGAKEYLPGTWYDSLRSEECAFTTAADGQERCLPDGSSASVFADSACTMPILLTQTGCAAPLYAITIDGASCSTPLGLTHVLAVGASVSPSALYVQAGGSNCITIGSPPSGYTLSSVGAEIPASSFVSATEGHD